MLIDLNILRLSPFFSDVFTDRFPNILPSYHVSGERFKYSYFLADGAYAGFKFLLPTISDPEGVDEMIFCIRQEAVRKCAERIFGVLHSRFNILKNPSHL